MDLRFPVLTWLSVYCLIFVSSNPEYHIPLVPECISLALCILSLLYLPNLKSSGPNCRSISINISKLEFTTISILIFTIVGVGLPRALLSLDHSPNQMWTPCKNLNSIFQTLECFLQAAYNQNFGMRTYFLLVSSSFYGLLGWFIAKSNRISSDKLAFTFSFAPFSLMFISIFSLLLGISQPLPEFVFINTRAHSQFTYFIANPGWIWPYLAPAFALSLIQLFRCNNKLYLLFFSLFSSTFSASILLSQQRGGYLLLGLFLAVSFIYFLLKKISGSKLKIFSVFATFMAIILFVYHADQIIKEVGDFVGYPPIRKFFTFDEYRISIWKAGWNLFRDKLFTGHGYASWFHAISQYDPTNKLVFDTAHNLYVQLFAELGIFNGILILFNFFMIFLCFLRSNKSKSHKWYTIFVCIITFLLPTMFQEIDYLRPTFFMHAFFWGIISAENTEVGKPIEITLTSIKTAALIFVTIAILGINIFAWNGYAFESSIRQIGAPIERWFGADPIIPVWGNSKNKAFMLYENVSKTSFREGEQEFRITPKFPLEQQKLFIPLEPGRRFWPKRHKINFLNSSLDHWRLISGRLKYPATPTNLALYWTYNTHNFEINENRLGFWCSSSCSFIAKPCKNAKNDFFYIRAPRPDLNSLNKLEVEIEMAKTDQEFFELGPIIGKSFEISNEKHVFNSSSESILIKMTDVTLIPYLVNIRASHHFNPAKSGSSNDNRDLGVMILEPDCE